MSDSEEEESIIIQPENVDNELEKIDEDIHDADKREDQLIERLKEQLKLNNKLMEDTNQYPNIRRYGQGFLIVLIIVSFFIFLNATQNCDHDLY